jgi:hypothetical protein
MKKIILSMCLLAALHLQAQELFVYSEPASNMAARTLGIRLQNNLMLPYAGSRNEFNLLPEVMVGVSRKIMIHADAILSDRTNTFKATGGSVYLKYRFFSSDDVHSHLRLACFGRVARNSGPVFDHNINLQQQNSGYEMGLVATRLKNKIAVSLSASWLRASDNKNDEGIGYDVYRNKALAGSLSVGKLMLPKVYEDYRQVNLNAMLEVLGQVGQSSPADDNNSYLDLAPSLQLILLSKIRVELGYRFPLIDNTDRAFDRSVLLRMEYNFFNVF